MLISYNDSVTHLLRTSVLKFHVSLSSYRYMQGSGPGLVFECIQFNQILRVRKRQTWRPTSEFHSCVALTRKSCRILNTPFTK